MSANTNPIYSRAGLFGAVAVTAANTSSQGGGTIGTDMFLALTADATNGSYVRDLTWVLTESVIGTASTATVGRVFISTKASGATTSADTWLYSELALPTQTPTASAGAFHVVVPFSFILPAGYTILVTNHAAPAANTQWIATVRAGQY